MRRTITTLIALGAAATFGASDAAAQTIGFKLGAGFGNMTTDQTGVETTRNTGFVGGGHIRFGLGGRIGLQAELLSVTKGANFTGGNTNYDLRFEYVEIPVLVHIPLTTAGISPYVIGGAAVGLEVKCRVMPTGGTSSQQRDCSDAGAGQFDRTSPDFGLVGGAGLAIPMGPGSVIVEGRYTHGFRNLDATAGGRDLRHRVASVMAGYEIPLVRSW